MGRPVRRTGGPAPRLLLPLLLLSLEGADGTVTVTGTGRQYHSRPASFGYEMEYGLQYVALLQVVEDDLHLCDGAHEESDGEDNYAADLDRWGEGGGTGSYLSERVPNEGGSRGSGPGLLRGERGPLEAVNVLDPASGNNSTEHQPEKKEEEGPREINVTPSHGVPIAILAKRGQCSYETKARVAQTLTTPHGAVRFVVVYNDDRRAGQELITMAPRTADRAGTDKIGLVFVSYENGVDLHEYINMLPPPTLLGGGPRVLIDGSDRWIFPPSDESAAGLAFLLMLFGCVCSVSLLLNNSLGRTGLAADGHLFFLGPDGLPLNPGGGRGGDGPRRGERGLRLLTMEEVETLPTVEYSGGSGGGSGGDVLEMRDKTDSPYAPLDSADDELGGSPRPDAEEGGGAGGGLEEPLLPSKDDGGDGVSPTWARLHSTSCSICLDDYAPGEQVRVLPCGHTFHGSCIFPWLTERSPTCPLCKAMFEAVPNEADEDEEAPETSSAADGAASVDDEGGATPPASPPDDRRRRREERERAREERAADRESARAERRSARRGSRRTSVEEEEADGGGAGAPPAADRGRPPSPPEVPRGGEERAGGGTRSLRRWLSGALRSPAPRSSDVADAALAPPSSGLNEPLLGSTDDSGSSDNDEGNIV